MTQLPIRLAVVDDHPLFRSGIVNYLNSVNGFEVALEAADGGELLNAIEQHAIDVILMDLEMPKGIGGHDTLLLLNEKYDNRYPVLIVSHHNDESFITNLILAGARGYLVKDSDPDEIKDAVLGVHQNGFHFTSMVSYEKWFDIMRKQSSREKTKFTVTDELTDRQKQVVKLICEQKSAKEIADELFITPRAVENHKARIMDAIGARNLVGIAIYGIKHGICDCV